MEKVHDYNFCPSCGHKLQGDENICPFCAYRLHEPEEKLTTPLNADQSIPDVFCPACNTKILTGEIICSFCGFRLEGTAGLEDHHKVVEKHIGKGVEENKIPVAEVPKEKGEVNIHPTTPVVDSVPADIPPPLNVPQEPAIITASPKGKTGRYLIFGAIGLVAIVAVLCVLQYSGVVNIPGLNKIFPAKHVVIPRAAIDKNYYYCYASATVKGKSYIIISNVFNQEQVGNNTETAKAAFNRVIRLQYPSDYALFKPVLCKQGDVYLDLSNERDELKSGYLKKKFNIRFVDVH